MTEMQSLKVYELAKELGMDSISLLDKLNSLNIKVKNHMSELTLGDVQTARLSLNKKSASSSASTIKKTVVRARKKVESPAATTAAAQTTTASAPTATKTSSVIRRRATTEGADKVTTRIGNQNTENSEEETEALQEASTHEPAAYVEPTDETQYSQPESQTEETHEIEGKTIQNASKPTNNSFQEANEPKKLFERKPVVLAPRPVAPRKSFLKIVEASALATLNIVEKPKPSPIKPVAAVKGTSTQDKDGFRIIKMTKENLDQMAEEENQRRKGNKDFAVIRPEDVKFADYRKKELVFLPKKKRLPVGKEIKRTQITKPKAIKRVVEMSEAISIHDFAGQLGVKANDVIKKLFAMGTMATLNQSIDFDTATLIAAEYQFEVKNTAFKEATLIDETTDSPEDLTPRPAIVTIMGHVDHGKTSLLDVIRQANVAAGEAGGITQHIGAYTVEKDGKFITFIDTPGHEAFTTMRARGANVTDIVILVVAADDGVMPQTREALSHAQAAGVPIIVAVNKMDKPGANPEKVKQVLAELNLLAEDWGGQTMFIPVSALKKTGIDKLLEAINLQSEILELKGNTTLRPSGTILEARLEKGRGPVVSVLIKRGILKCGDAMVSGSFVGRVKAMTDYNGKSVKNAMPGFAVEILGFEGVPSAGEKFDSPESEADARKVAENRDLQTRNKNAIANLNSKMSLDDLFSKIKMGNLKELGIILKTDVFGSAEAIRDSLQKLSNDQVKVKVIHSGIGGITESDILLATASEAIIIGFNVRPETKARQVAESEGVEIKTYSIIYELIDDVKKSMTGLLDKKKVEKFLGRAEVRQTFTVPKIGTIAGCSIIDGKFLRGASVRLLRESRVVFEGKMSSLKRFKDDVKEVATGFECGIAIENYNDLKTGDIIEAFQIDMIAPEMTF